MTCYRETLVLIRKPLRKKTIRQHVYGQSYSCPRLITPPWRLSIFWGVPKRSCKWEGKCAACFLLRPGFIKLGLNAFLSLIKLLGQWLMIVQLSETSREGRWGPSRSAWTWINDRESGWSRSAWWDFCYFPPRALNWLPQCWTLLSASLKFLSSGSPVGSKGREKREGGWAAVSCAKPPQSHPAPVPLAPQSLPFLFSVKLPEGMSPTHLSTVLSPRHIPVWVFMLGS